VHAHWTYEYALAAQDSGLPHLITVHDEPWEILKDFRNFFFFLRLLVAIQVRIRSTNEFVFVSDYIRSLWHKRMFKMSGEVIPNMNRLEISPIEESKRLNHVIAVGNTDRRKNIRRLLAAWQIVVLTNPDSVLHLVGPGLGASDPMAREFEAKFDSGQVIWHGSVNRDELSELYGRSKLLVHPSLHESFGLIYLEAFAGDIGIITLAKSGSTSEVVGTAGVILSDDSPQSLAQAILNLSANRIHLNQITASGRERLELYSPELVTRMYLTLYERTMGILN